MKRIRTFCLLVASACLLFACADEDLVESSARRESVAPTVVVTSTRVPRVASAKAAPAAALTSTAAVEGKSWVAIAHARHDVYELHLEDVRRVLTGEVRDWRDLGGTPAAIEAFVPAEDVAALATVLGVPVDRISARRLDGGALIEAVRRSTGAFALVRPEALTPDVLALVVEGHDPLGDPASTSPLRTAGVVPAFDPVLVVSPGEILPVRCANAALEAHGDFNAMFEDVRPLLERADVAIGALDAPLTDVSPPTPCERTFVLQGGPRAAEAIAAAGIDVMFVNGNHMLDCWQPCPPYSGLRDTLARLHRLGVGTAGAGENVDEARRAQIVEVNAGPRPIRLALLAYDGIMPGNWATASTPGIAPLRREVVIEDVRAARQVADIVIVGMSWGIEYETDPTSNQRDLAAAAVEAGASLVIGNHPHVVQAIERRGGSLVLYAQGNYVFDQSWSTWTMQAVLIQAGFVDGQLIGYRLRPVVTRGSAELFRGLYRPELVPRAGVEGREILGRIFEAQDRLPR